MTDADLLERLAGALAPAGFDTAPPPASLAVVMAAVQASASPKIRPRRVPRWWARKVAAAGAALAVVGSGAGVAFAAGAPMPAAVRDAAHDAGLPVDSSTAIAARGALRALSDAEDHGNATSIAARADALQALLARLHRDEREDLAKASARALDAAATPPSGVAHGDQGTSHVSPDPTVPPVATPPAHDAPTAKPAPGAPEPPAPTGPNPTPPKPHGEPTPPNQPAPAHRG